jgi:hypothetical protein
VSHSVETRYFQNAGSLIMTKLEKRLEVIIIIMAIAFSRPNSASLISGGFMMILGITIRIWVSGYSTLSLTTGLIPPPYRFSRAPHLLGSCLQRLGILLAAGNSLLLIAGLGIMAIVNHRKWQSNEQNLSRSSGQRYIDYRSTVPPFLPGLFFSVPQVSEPGLPAPSKFSLSRALLGHRHRELDGLIATAIAIAILTTIAKVMY